MRRAASLLRRRALAALALLCLCAAVASNRPTPSVCMVDYAFTMPLRRPGHRGGLHGAGGDGRGCHVRQPTRATTTQAASVGDWDAWNRRTALRVGEARQSLALTETNLRGMGFPFWSSAWPWDFLAGDIVVPRRRLAPTFCRARHCQAELEGRRKHRVAGPISAPIPCKSIVNSPSIALALDLFPSCVGPGAWTSRPSL